MRKRKITNLQEKEWNIQISRVKFARKKPSEILRLKSQILGEINWNIL